MQRGCTAENADHATLCIVENNRILRGTDINGYRARAFLVQRREHMLDLRQREMRTGFHDDRVRNLAFAKTVEKHVPLCVVIIEIRC